ncbi:MAG: hypothetical protein ACOCYZ_00190 [Halococcoides sp.]
MDIGRIDIAVFVYNLAVVASGVAVVTTMGIESATVAIGAAIPLAIAWTAYMRLSLIDRLLDIEAAKEGDADDEAGEDGARPPWEH